jgi:hypothetical protein
MGAHPTYEQNYEIASIVSAEAGAAILVTFVDPVVPLSQGTNPSLRGTGVPSYEAGDVWMKSIPAPNQVVLSPTFVSNVGAIGAEIVMQAFNLRIGSNSAADRVATLFFTGNNPNFTYIGGCHSLMFNGTRFKAQAYMDWEWFTGDVTAASDIITNIIAGNVPGFTTANLQVGQNISGTGETTVGAGVPGTQIIEIVDATTVRVRPPLPTQTGTRNITSKARANNVMWMRPPDVTFNGGATVNPPAAAAQAESIPFTGPGSIGGWGILGWHGFGTTGATVQAGSYGVGMSAPYTAGGMTNNRPTYINENLVTNTGLQWRINSIKWNIQGDTILRNTIIQTENNLNPQGTVFVPLGADVEYNTRAFLSNSGSVFGSAICRWQAPLGSTPAGETDDGGGFIVLPGNPLNNTVHFMLGASPDALDLSGDFTTIQALPNVLDIRGIPQVSAYAASAEYFRFSGAQATVGSSFLHEDGDFSKSFYVANDSNGPAAGAQIGVRNNFAGATTAVRMHVFGTGFTTAGIFVQDGGAVYSDTALSGGLSVAALAGNLRISAAGEVLITDLPTADPGVPGALWRDAGAANVLKVSP